MVESICLAPYDISAFRELGNLEDTQPFTSNGYPGRIRMPQLFENRVTAASIYPLVGSLRVLTNRT